MTLPTHSIPSNCPQSSDTPIRPFFKETFNIYTNPNSLYEGLTKECFLERNQLVDLAKRSYLKLDGSTNPKIFAAAWAWAALGVGLIVYAHFADIYANVNWTPSFERLACFQLARAMIAFAPLLILYWNKRPNLDKIDRKIIFFVDSLPKEEKEVFRHYSIFMFSLSNTISEKLTSLYDKKEQPAFYERTSSEKLALFRQIILSESEKESYSGGERAFLKEKLAQVYEDLDHDIELNPSSSNPIHLFNSYKSLCEELD